MPPRGLGDRERVHQVVVGPAGEVVGQVVDAGRAGVRGHAREELTRRAAGRLDGRDDQDLVAARVLHGPVLMADQRLEDVRACDCLHGAAAVGACEIARDRLRVGGDGPGAREQRVACGDAVVRAPRRIRLREIDRIAALLGKRAPCAGSAGAGADIALRIAYPVPDCRSRRSSGGVVV
jgi:hypothetical protein